MPMFDKTLKVFDEKTTVANLSLGQPFGNSLPRHLLDLRSVATLYPKVTFANQKKRSVFIGYLI